jgi:ubiquinone/menaquinone biosynthesis C-methylase UbiE
MLHLQCHFGLDTLSWARRDAQVTGVDFSGDAISLARSLSEELGIEAEFICSNICDLPEALDRQFDIVFTSYGVVCWLSDINRWAEIIRRYLKPGGIFYMVEFHPFIVMLDDSGDYEKNPYFYSKEPIKYEIKGSYAAPDADFTHTGYEWMHSLGDIVTALISAGLNIEFLHEFPSCPFNFWGNWEKIGPGQYVHKGCSRKVPHLFSIRARG